MSPATPDAVEAVARVLGARGRRDVPLGPRTTYQVGGAAALFFEARTEDELAALTPVLAATGVPVLVLGRGSNLLVADGGFAGLVVSLSRDAFGSIHISGPEGPGARSEPRWVRAGAAVPLPVLARQLAAAGVTGLEWAVGVPGAVGGALRMNAGGHGSDTKASLVRCRVVDLATGLIETWAADDLGFGYRRSTLGDHHVVVEAEHRVEAGDRAASEATIRDILRWRREHQPGGQNAGSVFVNPGGQPPANSAGWLVESSGLKGYRYGTAMISTKHANFIQADPGGSADDVVALMREVQKVVAERYGVVLRAELRLVGFGKDSISTLGSQ
ncbi:MAG: UDP-N-acetylmuramate dehydrogenase [Acidimicrobiales bacterium]